MNETRPVDRALPFPRQAMTAAEAVLSDRPRQSLAAAYEETHRAILAVLDGLSDRQRSTVVPACPAWTVRELVAHMTGVAADVLPPGSRS